MEQETLFTASKWDILKILSTGAKSPLQLAKLSNTSVANISQQLRLLEMAGLVQSKRISNRDKGQPRLLYSLVGNHSFLIASGADFVEKKFLKLSDYNKVILKIWFLDDANVHYFLEKAFWHLEENLRRVGAILLDKDSLDSDAISLVVLSDDSNLKKDLKRISVRNSSGQVRNINFLVQPTNVFAKSVSDGSRYYALYDPSNVLSFGALGSQRSKAKEND
ncbi:winged helix-turn-helix transcriptional regulator [Candidatus Woesearchaeota archaeon]|nr:winged helix-turn-helix transcriptional regulator [Candidatus Woesearchaeota archaeon]